MKKKAFVEKTANIILLICAVVAIFAVCAITLYMFIKGTPALKEVGVSDLLFGTIWKPTASNPSFGIGYIILTSIVGTGAAILIGVPIGLLTAVFLSEMAGKRLGTVVGSAVELLAAIPSVIYGIIASLWGDFTIFSIYYLSKRDKEKIKALFDCLCKTHESLSSANGRVKIKEEKLILDENITSLSDMVNLQLSI